MEGQDRLTDRQMNGQADNQHADSQTNGHMTDGETDN